MSEANVDDRLPQVMTGHIKTAAYAGECRLCPPPLFLILVSFLQIGFFVHQVLKLDELLLLLILTLLDALASLKSILFTHSLSPFFQITNVLLICSFQIFYKSISIDG